MNSIDVKKIREDLELTQQGFANLLGVDRRTVVNWEQGKKIPESKIKMFALLLEGKKNGSESSLQKDEIKTTPSTDLTREILELKDHIATLKNFLAEKTIILELYKNENLKLKEEIDELKAGG